MTSLDTIGLKVTVVLGRTRMPIHKLLRLGRGALIELESHENDEVEILANGLPIALGQVIVAGARISVEVTRLIGKPAQTSPATATAA